MKLQQRIELLVELGKYLSGNSPEWQAAREQAAAQNGWFLPEFTDRAAAGIASAFLQPGQLGSWAEHYRLDDNIGGKNIGIVMAGNIPLVGFHDFLSVFISGHSQTIKLSGNDNVLLKHLVQQLYRWEVTTQNYVSFADNLKGCDAYIATGSSNTARYFDYYFGKYNSIIRRNRSSAAILTGEETGDELALLADDICLYFGRGCRSITQLLVPEGYNFEPLLGALDRYSFFMDYFKYKNNYDYQLTLLLMNRQPYMTSKSILLTESASLFSPLSVLHYSTYSSREAAVDMLKQHSDLQCLAGRGFIPFGQTQQPSLTDYADGVDTMQFLLSL